MGIFIDKNTEISSTIKCNYHRIVELSFNSMTGRTMVLLYSYISKVDAEEGKAQYTQYTYELKTVNPLEMIVEGDVGTPVMLKVQAMLEAAIVAEVPEFAGATIG